MDVDSTFYLPLLPILRQEAENNRNEEEMNKVVELEKLPRIEIVQNNNMFGFPIEAGRAVSHGGYLVRYSIYKGIYFLAIRDINSSEHDECERDTPFTFIISGDDKSSLDKLAIYTLGHLSTVKERISKGFSYDPDKNGLRFDLSLINSFVKDIVGIKSLIAITENGKVDISSKEHYLVIPMGISKDLALKEQDLLPHQSTVIPLPEIAQLDNHQNVVELLVEAVSKRKERFSKAQMLGCIGGATLLGIVIGYCLSK
jgi:hypothetical protein